VDLPAYQEITYPVTMAMMAINAPNMRRLLPLLVPVLC